MHTRTHAHTHTHRCVWTRCSMHRITSEPFTNLVEQVGQLLWFCFANKDLETWKVTVIGCQAKPCHSIPDPQTPSPASFPLCQFASVRGISHWQYKIPMVPGILLKKVEFHVKSFPFKFFFKSFWIYQGERCSLEDQNVFSTLKYLLICLFWQRQSKLHPIALHGQPCRARILITFCCILFRLYFIWGTWLFTFLSKYIYSSFKTPI